jgi:hypothetical protein
MGYIVGFKQLFYVLLHLKRKAMRANDGWITQEPSGKASLATARDRMEKDGRVNVNIDKFTIVGANWYSIGCPPAGTFV